VLNTTGFWVHEYHLRVRDTAEPLYAFYILFNVFSVSMICAKTAILLEWIRIFVPRGTRNKFFWICHIVMWANNIFYTVAIINVNLVCTPQAAIWMRWLRGGQCMDRMALDLSSSCINLVFDLIILFLPQRVIWRLRMSTRERVGISLVFSTGVM
jgi:hypothetical protein